MEESEKEKHVVTNWWKKKSNIKKQQMYGKRVALMKQLGCSLFGMADFFGVLSFLFLFEGRNGKNRLEDVVKLEEN